MPDAPSLVAVYVKSGHILWLRLAVLNSQGANDRDASQYYRETPRIRQSVVDDAQHGLPDITRQAVGKACKTAGRDSAPVDAFYSELLQAADHIIRKERLRYRHED